MNSENSKTSDPHGLLLIILDGTDLQSSDKYVALLNHRIYYTWRHMKKS